MGSMTTELRLKIGTYKENTVLLDSYCTSPAKIGIPRVNSDRLKIIIMMASPGLLKGDQLFYDIKCEKNTKTFITDQSYTKIFNTGNGNAVRTGTIQLRENASLYWRPLAVIPFTNSNFSGNTTIEMESDSELLYTDILSAGRIAHGELFYMKAYRNKVTVKENGHAVWSEYSALLPNEMNLKSNVFFGGYTHQGTFYYHGKPETESRLLNVDRDIFSSFPVAWGISSALKGICFRVLARSAQEIEEIFELLIQQNQIDTV